MDLKFRKITLEDREPIQRIYMEYPSMSCTRSFANTYLWARYYKVTAAEAGGTYIFRSENEEEMGAKTSFAMPAGSRESVRQAVASIMEYCRAHEVPLQIYSVTEQDFALLEELFPGTFSISYSENDADYVYESEKLITLAGKKYHGKRNYINRFHLEHPDWTYESITHDNVEDCFQMALKWRNENGCNDDPEKCAEMCVALNSLRLMDELSLRGGLIRTEGKVVAFSIGEGLNEDTFDVHIEKAFADVPGAYPIINQQFVLHETEGFKYINREEDVGSEGLRIAKRSYHPVIMVNKGVVVLKEDA